MLPKVKSVCFDSLKIVCYFIILWAKKDIGKIQTLLNIELFIIIFIINSLSDLFRIDFFLMKIIETCLIND